MNVIINKGHKMYLEYNINARALLFTYIIKFDCLYNLNNLKLLERQYYDYEYILKGSDDGVWHSELLGFRTLSIARYDWGYLFLRHPAE
jgi:hypothetical protein